MSGYPGPHPDNDIQISTYQTQPQYDDPYNDQGRSSAEYHHHDHRSGRDISTSRGRRSSTAETREQHSSIQMNAIGQLASARRTLPVLALIYLGWNLLEIVGFSIVLAMTWDLPCDEPTIRALTIARIIRDAVMVPVHLRRVLGYPETNFDYNVQAVNRISLLFFFILSQQWLTDGSACRKSAPALYWSGIAIITLLYLTMLAPLLLLLAICLCLPCILGLFRVLNIGTTLPQAASSNDLEQLPTFEYDPDTYHEPSYNHEPGHDFEMVPHPDEGDEGDGGHPHTPSGNKPPLPLPEPQPDTFQNEGTAPPLSPVAQPTYRATPSQGKWRTPKGTAPPELDVVAGETTGGAPPGGATASIPECSICLCEFEKGEAITKLRCDHSFHKDCVTSWLKLNRTCPICRKDAITGAAADVGSRGRYGLNGLL